MVLVDANVLLRFFLHDHEEHYHLSKEFLKDNTIKLIDEVVAEVVYVLEKVYDVERETIAEVLSQFMDCTNVHVEDKGVLKLALLTYAKRRTDFVDSILYATHKVHGQEVFTFDRKLMKMIKSEDEEE